MTSKDYKKAELKISEFILKEVELKGGFSSLDIAKMLTKISLTYIEVSRKEKEEFEV